MADLGLLQHPRWSSTGSTSEYYKLKIQNNGTLPQHINKCHYLRKDLDITFLKEDARSSTIEATLFDV